jgi:translin
MEAMNRAREEALACTRRLTQVSAKSVRHIHRRQFQEAAKLLDEARTLSLAARKGMEGHPELLYAGYLQDAEREMVEAAAVLAMVRGTPPPTSEGLGVGPTSFLNGMGEAASECRRYVLDEMRRGRLDEAERILGLMEGVYDDLIGFDFSDAMTGGLRRTCDALRAVIERTRSDLTMTYCQQQLLEELRAARGQES